MLTKEHIESVKRIEDLRRQQDEKIKEIKLSLMLQDLWPQVFDNRPLKIRLDGSPNNISNMKYVVEGKEETRKFKITEVYKPLIESILIPYRYPKSINRIIIMSCKPDPFKEEKDENNRN